MSVPWNITEGEKYLYHEDWRIVLDDDGTLLPDIYIDHKCRPNFRGYESIPLMRGSCPNCNTSIPDIVLFTYRLLYKKKKD